MFWKEIFVLFFLFWNFGALPFLSESSQVRGKAFLQTWRGQKRLGQNSSKSKILENLQEKPKAKCFKGVKVNILQEKPKIVKHLTNFEIKNIFFNKRMVDETF
jgi:hypothetical protein